jgi:hypothetical protein
MKPRYKQDKRQKEIARKQKQDRKKEEKNRRSEQPEAVPTATEETSTS